MRAWLIVIVMLLSGSASALGFTAQVKKAHDGDSLAVTGPEGGVIHVRLYGVDAPEAKQRFGYQAKKRLAALAARKTVEVEPLDTDRYGRTVALVRNGEGQLVNEVLVAEGLAWVYDEYCRKPFCQDWAALQQEARRQRRGLWVEDEPQRPEEWRRENKAHEWYMAPIRAVKRVARAIKSALPR